MSFAQVHFWPGVPDLAALGARQVEDLLGTGDALEEEERAEVVAQEEGRVVLRYPLPGTVTRVGERGRRPRGAGTGFVYLTRWTGGSLSERMSARLTPPRSSSFAAREWNLICHLREHGVGTAEPLAMGEERASVFARRSFLVTRELESMQRLPDYLAREHGAEPRRHLAHALGLFVARLRDARVELPGLELRQLFVSISGSGESCAVQQLSEALGADTPVSGLRRSRLPQIALTSVRGGRVREAVQPEAAAEWLRRWVDQLEPAWEVSPLELARVAHHALTRGGSRARRRALWHRHLLPSRAR